jgi:large subunit ribosomal protein L25
MTHDTPSIAAKLRERTGTRYARRLRQVGRLPGVIYGHKTDPIAVSVDATEVLTHIRHGLHVMKLKIEGGRTETCLVKDLQFGYLGDDVVHVDFTRVNLREEVTVHVRIDYVGTPAEAHHAGAILRHDHTELGVRCLVSKIPEEIKVDLGSMVGMHLTAAEVPLPPGITLADSPETIIASVQFLKRQKAEVGEEAAVEAELEEPEVITEAKAEEDRAATAKGAAEPAEES